MDEIKLKRRSQEDIIQQLIFDVSMLKVLVNKLQKELERHTHDAEVVSSMEKDYPDWIEIGEPKFLVDGELRKC